MTYIPAYMLRLKPENKPQNRPRGQNSISKPNFGSLSLIYDLAGELHLRVHSSPLTVLPDLKRGRIDPQMQLDR